MIGGNSGIGGGPIRPPLYVPTKRDGVKNANQTSSSFNASQQPEQDQVKKSTGFKTEFNSNLYSGVSQQPVASVPKKPTGGSNSLFKMQPPTAQFEAGVKRYQDPSNTQNRGIDI